MTVKELIDLLSKLPDHSDEVVIEVNHGDLRDIVSRKVTKEKVNNLGTIVCDDEEEKGKNVVVISV